jgi:Cu2+-exporting ATPase
VLSSLTKAVWNDLLIKGGRSIEKLASVDAIVFDKTGTLTTGNPEVVDVITLGRRSPERLLALAAAAEVGLNHPAANAVVRYAEDLGIPLPSRDQFYYELGRGVKARVRGQWVLVGNREFLHSYSSDGEGALEIGKRLEQEGKSPLFVAINGKLAGAIAYADPLRNESEQVIRGLKERGIHEIHILTGDTESAARRASSGLHIDNYQHGVFPEEKLQFIQELKSRGYTVAVVGDGINDSPALAHADVSISFRHGADVARETADVVLMNDDLNGLLKAIDLSRDAMRLIRQNMNLVAAPNAVAMFMAALGWLSPVHATVINNGSTVVVGLNGLRPLISRKNRIGD